MAQFEARPAEITEARQRRQLKKKLYDPGEKHTPGQSKGRTAQPGREAPGRCEQADIEPNGGDRWERKGAVNVLHPRGKGGEGDKKEIGRSQHQQFGGERTPGIGAEPRRKDPDNRFAEDHRGCRQHQQ